MLSILRKEKKNENVLQIETINGPFINTDRLRHKHLAVKEWKSRKRGI